MSMTCTVIYAKRLALFIPNRTINNVILKTNLNQKLSNTPRSE